MIKLCCYISDELGQEFCASVSEIDGICAQALMCNVSEIRGLSEGVKSGDRDG